MELTENGVSLQAEEEPYNSGGWNSTSFNETSDSSMFSPQKTTSLQGLDLLQAQEITDDLLKYSTFSRKPSNLSDMFAGEVFTTNRFSNSEQQPDASNLSISSLSREQYSLPSENTNDFMDLTQHIFDWNFEEFSNSENKVALPKNIDVLQQTRSFSRQQIEKQQKSINCHSQEPSTKILETVSQQSSLKQSPRKKRRVSRKGVPDSVYFTIACLYCRDNSVFSSPYKSALTSSFKKHAKNKHSDKTAQETQIYINEHLQEPKLHLQFSICCPESECKHVAFASQKSIMKKNLFRHISIQHPENKGHYSKESVGTHVENNCTKAFVSKQEQSKFTIVCYHCFFKKQFKSSVKRNLIDSFKEHLNNQHSNITKEETKAYIDQHLQEPELFVKLSIHCPESECQTTFHGFCKRDLKINLSYHVLKSKKHQNKKQGYSKESLAMHVDNNCKKIFVPAQKQLKSTKKKKN